MDAADPTPARTLAVLLGASWLPRAPALAQGAAFSRSAQQFLDYLLSPTGLALPRENVNHLFDDNRSAVDQLGDLSDFLERRCREIAAAGAPATDLVIYYAGNGLFCGPDRALHLSTRITDPARDSFTSLPVGHLAHALSAGAAASLRKFLVLDLSFASTPAKELPPGALDAAYEQILGHLPQRGAALLCAASLHDPLQPADLACTPFTGCLVESLHQGQTDLPPRISLSELGPLVKEHLRRSLPQEHARPTVHAPDRREGHIAHIGLFPNPAYQERQADERPLALVVDDSNVVRTVTQRLLERHGIRVIVAGDGVEAVELLKTQVPAVILLDIEMPRMDGFGVAAHVRQDLRTRDVPIVMITASEGTRNRAKAFDLGVDDYLSKPYREAQLLSVVRPLINQARAPHNKLPPVPPAARHEPPAAGVRKVEPPAAVPAPAKEHPAAPVPVLPSTPAFTRDHGPAHPVPAHPSKEPPAAPLHAAALAAAPGVTGAAAATGTHAIVSTDGGAARVVTLPARPDPLKPAAPPSPVSGLHAVPVPPPVPVAAPVPSPVPAHAPAPVPAPTGSVATTQRGWAVGDSGRIIEMAAGGETWISRRSATRRELNAIHFTPDGLHGWAVGFSGTVIATRDGGRTWVRQRSQTRENLNAVVFSGDARRGWAVGAVGEVIATRDGGLHWERQESDTTYGLNCVHFAADGRHGWAAGADCTVIATRNGGRTWLPQSTPTRKKLFSLHFLSDIRHGWAVGHRGVVLATEDGGETWAEQNSHTDMHLYSVFFVDGRRGWAAGRNGVLIATDNGGKTWLEQHSRTEATLSSVYFAADGLHGWAVGYNGTVITSSDGGRTWKELRGASDMTLNCVCFLSGGQSG